MVEDVGMDGGDDGRVEDNKGDDGIVMTLTGGVVSVAIVEVGLCHWKGGGNVVMD